MSAKYTKDFVLISFSLCCLYFGLMPVDQKCDLTLSTIDYTLNGAANLHDMIDGKMDLFSYIRQNIAQHLKKFYDNSEC